MHFLRIISRRISANFLFTKQFSITSAKRNTSGDDSLDAIINTDNEFNALAENYLRIGDVHRCLLVQPYVKWGPKKLQITPEEQLEEACALINTLPGWKVVEATKVPLEALDMKTLVKKGTMERLSSLVQSNRSITSVFVNVGNLTPAQMSTFQENFGRTIFDRYKIVMQILRTHATSKYAKLQVSLAELYYLERKIKNSLLRSEIVKLMFQNREKKLKDAIKDLRAQRALLRTKRTKLNYPIVAVVGYTNAGKTSLIKSFTGEEKLKPRNQLFATLDVTMHSGFLPCGLEVLYVDTVGFISDIPSNLIECFVATLEDAVLADVILHVEDLSNSCYHHNKNVVLKTLKDLGGQLGCPDILNKVVSVGNKADRVENLEGFDVLPVSATTQLNLDKLGLKLEEIILSSTNRKRVVIRVLNGSDEIRWLYKNATIISQTPDEEDNQYVFAKVIITSSKLSQFKNSFI